MIEGRLKSITLPKLRIFAAVARERGFARGADAVDLSSPTVSAEIKSLEGIVGLRLMNRSRGRKQVELTEAGEALLQCYEEICHSVARAGEAMDAIMRVERGSVSFGADMIFGGYLLPLLHDTFCRDNSGISIRVEVDNRQRILEGVTQGRLDLAVLLGPDDKAGLVQEPFIPFYAVPVGPPGHRLSGPAPAPFEEFARERLVLGTRSTQVRGILEQMAAGAGVPLNVVLEVAGVDAPLQAARAGIGITVLSSYCVAADLSAGRLSLLQVQGFPIRQEWSIIHRQTALTPTALALKRHLLKCKGTLEDALSLPKSREAGVQDSAAQAVLHR